MSAGYNFNAFDGIRAGHLRRDKTGPLPHREASGSRCQESSSTPFTGAGREDALQLRQILEFTLAREAFAANVIQGLSYRVDCNSELSQRARSYAREMRHYIARLKALLPKGVCPASDDHPLRKAHKRAIEGLEADAAKLVLINFLHRHAETTCWTLSSDGDYPRSRAVEMLKRQADRERLRIALWIDEYEANVAEKPDERLWQDDFRRWA